MSQEDYDFFRNNGYLSLGKILSDDEVTRFTELFDQERRDRSGFWKDTGIWQTIYGDALLTTPEFNDIVRHPRVMEALQALMGDELCFSEIILRHMGPYAGESIPGLTSWEGRVGHRWHRDGGERFMWPEHPLRIGLIMLIVYLADVDATTHSLAVSPESVDQEILDKEAQLERGGIRELYGTAGTATLLNVSVLHSVSVRPTQSERKSVQISYGHRHRGDLEGSSSSMIPASLWRDHPDGEARRFYGVLTGRTREYLQRTAARDLPVNEALEILADINKR